MDSKKAMAQLDSRVESDVLEAIEVIRRERHQPAIDRLAQIVEPKEGKESPRKWTIKQAAVQALGEMQNEEALSVLLHILSCEPYPRREAMKAALLSYDISAIFEPVVQALQSEQPGLRTLAAEVLGELGDPRGIEPLMKAMRDDNGNVANAAAHALHAYGDPELDRWFLEALVDEKSECRAASARILNEMGSEARFALPALVETVAKEDHVSARHQMIEALAEIGDPSAIQVLAELLCHERRPTTQKAVKALRKFNTTESIQALKDFYRDKADSERRYDILVALAGVEDEEVLTMFDAALDEGDRFTTSAVVTEVLAWGYEAKPLVERMLFGSVDNHSRDVLIRKIGSTQDPFWLPTLLDVLTDPENSIRRYWHDVPYGVMAAALRKMGMEAEQELVALLDSEDPAVLVTCADALARLGSQAAIPSLSHLLQRGEVHAADALGKIGTAEAVSILNDVMTSEEIEKPVRIAARDALMVCGGDAATRALAYLDLPPASREVLVLDRSYQRKDFTTTEVSDLLQQRAEIFFSTLSAEAAFQPDLDQEKFNRTAAPIIQNLAVEFITDRTRKASAMLVDIYIKRFPGELAEALSDWLPSTNEGCLALFDRRLQRLHRALEESKAYVKPVSQQRFMEKADREAAEHLKRWMKAKEALDSLLVSAPIDALASLKRWLAYFHFDYEFGYKSFFQRLNGALEKFSIDLQWEYNESHTQYEIRLGDACWSIEAPSESTDVGEALYAQLSDITAWLADHGLVWKDIVSGDQTGIILLLPAGYSVELDELLPGLEDPRTSLFYGPAGISRFV